MQTKKNEEKTETNFGLPQQKEILSFKEAIDYLSVSKSQLYKLTSGKKIKFFKPNGGKLYFKRKDLNEWMLQNESVTKQVLEDKMSNYLNNNHEK